MRGVEILNVAQMYFPHIAHSDSAPLYTWGGPKSHALVCITDSIIIVDDRGGSHIGFNPHSGPSHPNPNHFKFDAIAKMFIVIL